MPKKPNSTPSQKVEMRPTQYDRLILITQRDQMAVTAAIVGFLLFFGIGLFSLEGGLAVYRYACSGAILFGIAGWLGGQALMKLTPADKPHFLQGAAQTERITGIREMPVRGLTPGMVLAAAVVDRSGEEILPAGAVLDAASIHGLQQRGVDMVLVSIDLV